MTHSERKRHHLDFHYLTSFVTCDEEQNPGRDIVET